jgi:hypothetical protein
MRKLAVVLSVALVVTGGMVRNARAATTWYVQAGAAALGDGTMSEPFDSLAAVRTASGPGDTIVVVPVPADVAPLDGGIVLQPGQHLLGGSSTDPGDEPRITNTNGDAVTLADDAEVAGLVVTGSFRGGIYGLDVTGTDVHDNDVSGFNTSCAVGFQILPIMAPSGIPNAGIPFGVRLPVYGDQYVLDINNGWAGIMVDASFVAGAVSIHDNVVHDSDCGDGIDVRTWGNAELNADVRNNVATNLRQGHFAAQTGSVGVDAINAIGFQSDNNSRLVVDAVGNTETYVGGAGSDCEGMFVDLSGSSTLIARIDHNTFAHGIGGSSCNGLEMISGNGDSVADLSVTNSTYTDDPGDMIEAASMGTGSKMHLVLDHDVITNTTIRAGAESVAVPFNVGDCLLTGNTGSGNVLSVTVRDTEISGCNNGIAMASNHAAGNGATPDGSMTLDIAHSRIHDNAADNLLVANYTVLDALSVKVADTDLHGAGDTDVAVDQKPGALTLAPVIDLGGGALRSAGGNCFFGATNLDAETTRYTVSARGNWWGAPGAPTKTAASPPVVSVLDTTAPLDAAPPICA